ncbi:FAD-dependent oxidoreductase [Streptomyces sp. NPDC058548]|uniref:FAD-dependent oxidoreductase n=1 Tax=unclassified Streptomyces TaxID=2593676 RepID=UPI0036515090
MTAAVWPPAETAPVTVVGAGLVGAVTAMYLARRYGRVDLVESRSHPRATPRKSGRSVNIVLSARGWSVLRDLGLEDQVRRICMPLRGRLIHAPDRPPEFQPYGRHGQRIWCVERPVLQSMLVAAAEETPGVTVYHDVAVQSVSLDPPALVTQSQGHTETVPCTLVVGCDGASSKVRAAMEAEGAQVHAGLLDLGYKEIAIPAEADGAWRFDPTAFHVWPLPGGFLSVFPNPEGHCTGSLFLPLHSGSGDGGGWTFDALTDLRAARTLIDGHLPEEVASIPRLAQQCVERRAGRIATVDCDRWTHGNTAVLVGDAAHAMAPFLGQGMNCGFQDARVLDRCLEQEPDLAAALASYQRIRKAEADAVTEASLEQHHRFSAEPPRATAAATRKTRVEERLYTELPDMFVPFYERLAFTEESYAEAQRRQHRVDRLVSLLTDDVGSDVLLELPADAFAAHVSHVWETTKVSGEDDRNVRDSVQVQADGGSRRGFRGIRRPDAGARQIDTWIRIHRHEELHVRDR